jgi:hypothetical protein
MPYCHPGGVHLIIGGVRERLVVARHGRGKNCAPAALDRRFWAAPRGQSSARFGLVLAASELRRELLDTPLVGVSEPDASVTPVDLIDIRIGGREWEASLVAAVQVWSFKEFIADIFCCAAASQMCDVNRRNLTQPGIASRSEGKGRAVRRRSVREDPNSQGRCSDADPYTTPRREHHDR